MKSLDRDAADEKHHHATCAFCYSQSSTIVDQASELATLRRRVETGSEHVIRYGQHLPNCPRGEAFAAGDVIPRECKCGFSDAISEAMFAPLPPGRNEG